MSTLPTTGLYLFFILFHLLDAFRIDKLPVKKLLAMGLMVPISRDLLVEGNVSSAILASQDVSGASAYDSIFSQLKFGYEVEKTRSNRNIKTKTKTKTASVSTTALCYSSTETRRGRGCGPLLVDEQNTTYVNPLHAALPCVTDGECPYQQFRCSKGHTWKAVSGSPVCFHCPICQTARKVYGKKKHVESTRTVDQLVKSLVDYVEERGGTVVVPSSLPSTSSSSSISTENSASRSSSILTLNSIPTPTDYLRVVLTEQHRHDKWAYRVTLSCKEGHQWSSKLGNLIVNKTWCRQCALNKRVIDDKVLCETATHFGGTFVSYLDELSSPSSSSTMLPSSPPSLPLTKSMTAASRKIRWRCAIGHEFDEYIGNIRRKKGSKRQCSWCRECRTQGKVFVWREDL